MNPDLRVPTETDFAMLLQIARHRLCFVNRTGDGAGEAAGCGMGRSGTRRARDRPWLARQWRRQRPDRRPRGCARAPERGPCHHAPPLHCCACACERAASVATMAMVVASPCRLVGKGSALRRRAGANAAPAEFCPDFPRGRPEIFGFPHCRGAQRIHRHQGGHRDAAVQHHRGRSQPAFQVPRRPPP